MLQKASPRQARRFCGRWVIAAISLQDLIDPTDVMGGEEQIDVAARSLPERAEPTSLVRHSFEHTAVDTEFGQPIDDIRQDQPQTPMVSLGSQMKCSELARLRNTKARVASLDRLEEQTGQSMLIGRFDQAITVRHIAAS